MRQIAQTFMRFILIIIGSIGLLFALQAEQSQAIDEYQLKAAFLRNFADFIFWPPASSETNTVPSNNTSNKSLLVFCVFGQNPFGTILEYIVHKTNDYREQLQEVRYIQEIQQLNTCNIVYISDSEAYRSRLVVQTLANQPVLTVSSIKNFAHNGGMIEFYLTSNKLRFYMNLGKIKKSGLTPDANLIELSTVVDLTQELEKKP